MVTNASTLKKRAARLWQRDALPREFAWMEKLTPLHYRLCLVELHAAIAQAHVTDDWQPVAELIEDWEATAELDASPELATHVHSKTLEFEEYVPSDFDD